MIDYNLIPNRDRMLENVYTSSPTEEVTVVNSGLIPSTQVETLSTVLPDLTSPIFELDGRWVSGTDVQTFYHKMGATTNLLATWFAIKDTIAPKEIQLKVAPEIQAATEGEAVQGLKRMITLAREKQFHTLATTSGNYKSGYTATPSVKWDAASSTTIVADIQAGIIKLEDSGLRANALIIPRHVYLRLKFAPELKNLYTGREYINLQFFKDFFEFDNIIVPSVTTTTHAKKTPVRINLWGENVIIAHIEKLGAGTYPSFVEARLEDALVQRLPMDSEHLTETIIARECKGINFIKNDAAYLLYNTLT